MGFMKDEMIFYGFRVIVLILLNECGEWDVDVIEVELGYVGVDEVRCVYYCVKYWDEWIWMFEWWVDKICVFLEFQIGG